MPGYHNPVGPRPLRFSPCPSRRVVRPADRKLDCTTASVVPAPPVAEMEVVAHPKPTEPVGCVTFSNRYRCTERYCGRAISDSKRDIGAAHPNADERAAHRREEWVPYSPSAVAPERQSLNLPVLPIPEYARARRGGRKCCERSH